VNDVLVSLVISVNQFANVLRGGCRRKHCCTNAWILTL